MGKSELLWDSNLRGSA